MRKLLMSAAVAAAVICNGQSALAKDHAVGAIAGAAIAPKHHRLAGAVVGGAVQHHMAKTKAKKQAAVGG